MVDTTPAIPEAVLDVVEPSGGRRAVRLTHSPFLIGRGQEAGNDLALPDKRISRQCAAVVFVDGCFRLEDRGQRHGVFVNGTRIDTHPLADGDSISFGVTNSYALVFRRGLQPKSAQQLLSGLVEAGGLTPGTRDLRQLSLLLEATALLQSQLPLEDILAAVVDSALEVTGADRGLLFQAEEGGELRPVLARQRRGGRIDPATVRTTRTAVNQALRFHRSVVVEDTARADLGKVESVLEQELRSVVAMPLLTVARMRAVDVTYVPGREDLLGLLYLDSRRPAAFSQLTRQILDALAVEAASVLDNARLVQKELDRRRMEQELSIAREIQQALLPKGFKAYPHCHVTGINRPCLEVGGDYFDLMQLGEGRIAFVIADVCGKGLGAALVTAILQGTFSAMTLGQEAAKVFAHVNRFICEHSEVQRYATLFFGTLAGDGALNFINAGHLPPILVRGGRAEPAFAAECLPLGLVAEANFLACTHRLQPGDTLVFYTDGITEAVDGKNNDFGLDRLRTTVQQHAAAPVEDLQAAILRSVEEFTCGAYQADDITLLILRYH